MGKKLYVHVGGTTNETGFKEVEAPNFKIHDGSATNQTGFKQIKKGYVHVGGTTDETGFKEFYVGSDPVKYVFKANRSASFRDSDFGDPWVSGSSGAGASVASVRVGAFSTSRSSYVGVFGFSIMEEGGLTLAQALAERPYITNATPTLGGSAENYIEFQRRGDGAGTIGNQYVHGTYYLARYNGDTTDANPDADDLNFTGSFSKTVSATGPFDSDGIAVEEKLKFDMNGSSSDRTKMQTFVDHADTQTLAITNRNSISDVKATRTGTTPTYGHDSEYCAFYGTSETYPPTLVITLDYVSA